MIQAYFMTIILLSLQKEAKIIRLDFNRLNNFLLCKTRHEPPLKFSEEMVITLLSSTWNLQEYYPFTGYFSLMDYLASLTTPCKNIVCRKDAGLLAIILKWKVKLQWFQCISKCLKIFDFLIGIGCDLVNIFAIRTNVFRYIWII